jgi:hypothetical protein
MAPRPAIRLRDGRMRSVGAQKHGANTRACGGSPPGGGPDTVGVQSGHTELTRETSSKCTPATGAAEIIGKPEATVRAPANARKAYRCATGQEWDSVCETPSDPVSEWWSVRLQRVVDAAVDDSPYRQLLPTSGLRSGAAPWFRATTCPRHGLVIALLRP